MDLASGIFALLGLLAIPALVVGAVVGLITRGVAKSRGSSPAEVSRRALKGFWIAFAISLALVMILFRLCISTLNQIG